MKNKELMLAAGSKDGASDPESPTQILWLFANGAPEERFLAWVKLHTIHMSRSPFCVDEHGKPVYLERAAADLGWTQRNTENVAYRVKAQGRCRVENKRIWYRADVPTRRIEGEQNTFVQNGWSAYLQEIFDQLPAEKRAVLEANKPKFIRWRDGLLADGLAQLRRIVEQVEDSMLEQVGVKKKRYRKSRTPKNGQLKLELEALPDFVQNATPETVQNPEPVLHNAETGSVQDGASLLPTYPDSYSKSVGQSVAAPEPEADRPTDENPPPEEPNAIANLLLEECAAAGILQGEVPSPALCTNIYGALEGAKLSLLRTRVRTSIERGKFKSMGLALHLAQEAARAWRAGEAAREKNERARRAQEAEAWADTERLAREVLADPRASPEDKAQAREILGAKQKGANT
jgi:hypothetical protein